MRGFQSALALAAIVASVSLASAEGGLRGAVEAALIDRDAAGLAALLADPVAMDDGAVPAGLLHRAVMTGDTEVVAAVLAAGWPVNARDAVGETALSLALDAGFPDIARLLAENHANPSIANRFGLLPWEVTAEGGAHLLTFRLLPNAGRARHATEWLFRAAAAGDAEAVRLAFAAGADLRAMNDRGRTLLQVALSHRHWSVVQYLLDLPVWARATALHPDSAAHLMEAAMLAPEGSPRRRFAVRAIGAFLATGMITPDDFVAAAPAGVTDAGVRQMMQDLGLPGLVLDRSFPPDIVELPPLEYSLPMNAPLDGITADHWRQVQMILRDEGLYAGPIDGIPGTGTFDGLYAYVVALAPRLIERGQVAHRLAREDRAGYGPLAIRAAGGGAVAFAHGRLIASTRTDMAAGYLAVSEDRVFGTIRFYRYDFRSIPANPGAGWRPRAVVVDGCDLGRVIAMTAPLFGRDLHVNLGETHAIRFSGVERYRLSQEMPGRAPVIPCD